MEKTGMEEKGLPFGEYVKQRRESLGLTMRELAERVKISPAYLCDIEKGHRKPPDKFLATFAEALYLVDSEELNAFYDSAGISKHGQHTDINSYMEDLPSARMALRMARDKNFTDADWLQLVEYIKSKS